MATKSQQRCPNWKHENDTRQKSLTVSKNGVLIRSSIPAGDSQITSPPHCPLTCYFYIVYSTIFDVCDIWILNLEYKVNFIVTLDV